jgi:hypothetical protein
VLRIIQDNVQKESPFLFPRDPLLATVQLISPAAASILSTRTLKVETVKISKLSAGYFNA